MVLVILSGCGLGTALPFYFGCLLGEVLEMIEKEGIQLLSEENRLQNVL